MPVGGKLELDVRWIGFVSSSARTDDEQFRDFVFPQSIARSGFARWRWIVVERSIDDDTQPTPRCCDGEQHPFVVRYRLTVPRVGNLKIEGCVHDQL